MKNIWKKILSAVIALLTVLGSLPVTGIAVYGASYTLNKVASLEEQAKRNESNEMTYITNFKNGEAVVHNNDFRAVNMPEFGRTCISPNNPVVPSKGKTASWQNVCTITYKKAGYTSKGKFINLECTLTNLKMTGTREQAVPDSSKISIADVTDKGLLSRAAFGKVNSGEFVNFYTGVTPIVESTWKIRVTDTSGKTMSIPPIAMLFRDIDIVTDVEGQTVRESVQVISGFDENIYISNNTRLLVSENNSLFEGNKMGETNDDSSMVLTTMNKPEATLKWRGLGCGTYITPTSLTGYPIPTNTKKVDRTTGEAGESLRYTIEAEFPVVSKDNTARSIRVIDELNDILDAAGAVTHVYKGDANDDNAWNTACDGQTIVWTAKDPGQTKGRYHFTIDVKIRDDMILDQRGELYIDKDGTVRYRIPNKDNIEITDHNGEKISVDPPKPVYTTIPVADLMLIKDVDHTSIENARAGDSLNYTFTIENTGLVSLESIELTDSLDVENLTIDWGGSSDPATGNGTLSPHEIVKGTAEYKILQSDIDSGIIHNTAFVTGTDELGVEHRSEDDADTSLGHTAGIDLTKDALPLKEGAGAGDTVSYRFEIKNTGNATLTKVTFADDHELQDLKWDREFETLMPGEKVSGSASYVLTQADVDAGEVVNTATVTGRTPEGSEVTDRDEAKTKVTVRPGILLEKSADPPIRTNAHAGDTVPFTFVITNTGNCSLTDITLEDALPGISDVVIDWSSSGDTSTGEGVLSSGESVSGGAFYTLTQTDIDRGSILNQAAVTGIDPSGNTVSSQDDAEVLLPENGEIRIEKVSEGEITEETQVGDPVHYVFTVTNTGNVTLSEVSILDELDGLGAIQYDWEGTSDASTPQGTLSPGEVLTACADYPLGQNDMDEGQILNKAAAVGKTPSGKDVTSTDDDLKEIPYIPGISIVKEVDRQTYDNVKAGDTLNYTFTVANTGKCSLMKVSILDELEGIGELRYDWSGASEGEGILKPGEIMRASAVYTITQDDINQGSVTNPAKASGYTPDKTPVTAETSVQTALQQNGTISVTKTADVVKVTDARPGDEIVYTMVAENTGNITVSNVEVHDDKEGLGELIYDWKEASGEHLLEPGERVTIHASYKITQEDIEQEKTDNTVIVTGRTPDKKEITPAEATVTTPVERTDSVKIEKSADRSLLSNAHVGDRINYTVRVSNTGNTILHEINLQDELTGLSKPEYDWSEATQGEGILLPGESMTMKAYYDIVQTDIDKGRVLNTAIVTSRNGKDEPLDPEEDSAETKLGGKASFTLTKTVDKTTITNAVAGDVLTYTIVGTNTGSLTLSDVTLRDTLKGATALTYDWKDASAGEGVLLPGESVTATCTYTVTQADISNGRRENTVIMTAKTPDGKTSERESKVTTILKRQPTPTPTPVRVNGNSGNQGSSTPQTVTTNSRTVNGSSPSQGGGTVTYSKAHDVKTGDETHAELWILLAAVAVTAGVAVLVRRKKNAG